MKREMKLWAQSIARKFGLEVKESSVKSRNDLRLSHFLSLHHIDLVLDVGANKGQFAQQLFAAGYQGRIISFEALPEEHAKLVAAAQVFGPRWIIAPRMALSDQAGFATFHVTAFSESSSLFQPNNGFAASAPELSQYRKIEVPTERLDDLFARMQIAYENLFIKLDTQGSELLVLSGAPKLLNTAKGMMSELSLRQLYQSQPPARDVYKYISASGFDLWDVWPGYRDPETFRLNEVDALFFRSSPEAADLNEAVVTEAL